MTSSIIKIALMFFLSNRNLQNRIVTFRKTYFSEICRNKVTAYNSHRLAPVFAVLSILGLIDDGRLQDFDRVPGASGNDAAVIAGGLVEDNACRFMEATPNCHILLLFNAISMSLFLVKHLDQFSMKQQYILGTVRMTMNRDRSTGKKSIEHTLAVVVG